MNISLRLCILPILAAAQLAVLPADEIRNGTFGEGTSFWFILVNGGFRNAETLAPFVKASPESLTILVDEIPGEKEKPAAVVLNQRVQSLKEGTEYVLRFEIKGHAGETLLLGLGNPVATGSNRGNLSAGIPLKEYPLRNDWQKIEIAFVYNHDQSLALPTEAKDTVLQFRVGKVTNFHLRAVSLTEK